MKKKKIYLLSGLLLISAILLFLTFNENNPDSTRQSQEVSLRADTKDLSIDDMMKNVETRKITSSDEMPPTPGTGFSSSGTTDGENSEAIAKVQAMIRANEENLSSGLQEIDAERYGRSVPEVEQEYVPHRMRNSSGSVSVSSGRAPEAVPAKEADKPASVDSVPVVKPKKRSPFNSIAFSSAANKNAIKAYVHSEQTVMAGSTLKMRLGEDALTDNGTLIPKNTSVFGEVTAIDGERVNVKITQINYQGNILPFEKTVYSKDALLGIYVPGNPKADATKEAAGGALDGLPSSGIPGVDAAAKIAGVVASSAANAGKQAISKNVRKVKVTIKTNYEIYLRPEERH